jgi:hypothetical protein
MFTFEEIKKRLGERPFVPFRIITTAGQSFEVRHPDLVLVGRRDLMVGFADSKNPGIYDGVTRLAILHVTAMEDLPVTTPPSSNGPGK